MKHLIEKLKKGEVVKFRPHGNSMSGLITSGELVTLAPIQIPLEKGDIVLCKVKGRIYLHLIKSIQNDRYQIGNNHGHINGWASRSNIFGIVIQIEP